jgi:hypothetical protein
MDDISTKIGTNGPDIFFKKPNHTIEGFNRIAVPFEIVPCVGFSQIFQWQQ